MSKQLDATAVCGRCEYSFPAKVYRTIWIEYPENRSLVLEDRVNKIACPRCGTVNATDLTLLCSNAELRFAIWYEPLPDSQIDEDLAGFARHLGATHYLAKAPRIHDWARFKEHLLELEASRLCELKASRLAAERPTYRRFWHALTARRRKDCRAPAAAHENVIRLDGNFSSFGRQLGQTVIRMLKEASESSQCTAEGHQSWRVIENWLGCKKRELTDVDMEKVGVAWQSYYAACPSPTEELQDFFTRYRRAAREEGLQIISVPDDVRRVFDRLLSAGART